MTAPIDLDAAQRELRWAIHSADVRHSPGESIDWLVKHADALIARIRVLEAARRDGDADRTRAHPANPGDPMNHALRAMLPLLLGHAPVGAISLGPVPFSQMRYQPPRWWEKQRGLGPVKQWVNLTETDMAMIEAAAIKRVERKQRRMREMGRAS